MKHLTFLTNIMRKEDSEKITLISVINWTEGGISLPSWLALLKWMVESCWKLHQIQKPCIKNHRRYEIVECQQCSHIWNEMEHGKGRRKFQNGARIRRTCVKKKKSCWWRNWHGIWKLFWKVKRRLKSTRFYVQSLELSVILSNLNINNVWLITFRADLLYILIQDVTMNTFVKYEDTKPDFVYCSMGFYERRNTMLYQKFFKIVFTLFILGLFSSSYHNISAIVPSRILQVYIDVGTLQEILKLNG